MISRSYAVDDSGDRTTILKIRAFQRFGLDTELTLVKILFLSNRRFLNKDNQPDIFGYFDGSIKFLKSI